MRTLARETTQKIGETVILQGWVNTRRDHGKIVFIDLRDRSGVVQTVIEKTRLSDELKKTLTQISVESVIELAGVVQKRPENLVNPKLETGTVEVVISDLKLLNKAVELPLPIDSDGHDINEEVRLKYRYLDLRRPRLQKNIKLRSKFVDAVRQFLFSQDFTEIETPLLTKSTPEGSRDFLVPARLQPGMFYALPQSPQQYKQLLMVASFERYFQIARCMRDEDLRADRGFEHTQIDLEMSFVDREAVMKLDEALLIHVVEALGYKIKQKPFPIFTYQEAMEKFGADKFDLRSDSDKKNGILAFAWVVDFPFFERTDEGGWTFSHNPFSMPKPEHVEWLLKKERIGEILTTQYDIVCNGYEVGGGSVRSNNPDILRKVFEIMGYAKERIDAEFGHMLEAFTYGAPPHGGLAHGIERLLMTITGEPYLREVVAFPQTSKGHTSVMDAPSVVSAEQLKELSIQTTTKVWDVYGEIVAFLKKQKVEYKEYRHDPVITSEDASRVRGTNLHAGAKALVLFADNKPVMIVLPADQKLDMKKFKTLYTIKDLRMATAAEVEKTVHVAIGAVPPLGNLFDIPLYMASSLRDNKDIVFNAGSHTISIEFAQKEYERICTPIVGEFVKDAV